MNKHANHANDELTLIRPRVISQGEKVHVIARRAFEKDVRRHFAGTVTAATESLIRAEGYQFICDPVTLRYVRKSGRLTRIFSLVDANLHITVLPPKTRIDQLEYEVDEGRLVVTDGEVIALEINEYNASS